MIASIDFLLYNGIRLESINLIRESLNRQYMYIRLNPTSGLTGNHKITRDSGREFIISRNYARPGFGENFITRK